MVGMPNLAPLSNPIEAQNRVGGMPQAPSRRTCDQITAISRKHEARTPQTAEHPIVRADPKTGFEVLVASILSFERLGAGTHRPCFPRERLGSSDIK